MKLSQRLKKAFPRDMTPEEIAEAERKQLFGDGKSLKVEQEVRALLKKGEEQAL